MDTFGNTRLSQDKGSEHTNLFGLTGVTQLNSINVSNVVHIGEGYVTREEKVLALTSVFRLLGTAGKCTRFFTTFELSYLTPIKPTDQYAPILIAHVVTSQALKIKTSGDMSDEVVTLSANIISILVDAQSY